jgi:hypothetical protein
MKAVWKRFATVMGIILMGSMLATNASAACGNQPGALHRQSSNGSNVYTSGSLVLAHNGADDAIVGMWKVTFLAKGNTGPDAPPDDAVIDAAIVQWHPDGTEIMNSGRPAQDGNFCLGVWEKVGFNKYKLNHFALGNDPSNAPSGIGNPAGPTHIQETVSLSRDGNHYSGYFILDATDPSGNAGPHIIGVIKATRITVNTPLSAFFD